MTHIPLKRELKPCPFCGDTGRPLPERDTSKPAEQQGLFRKFVVRRVDGSDGPGGKHEGCEYFVLDVDHDPHARDALAAYAASVRATHPALALDMVHRYELHDATRRAIVRAAAAMAPNPIPTGGTAP